MSPLPSRILRQVVKPARYTDAEWNSVHKPWEEGALLRVCLLYPDLYEAGAARPALSSLYQALNDDPGMLAERAFAPWTDLASALRAEGIPLASLESGRPLGDFDVLAVCLPQEMAATTVLALLELARLPLEAAARDVRHPLVVAWEERPLNPEPLADYLDAVLLGDAEAVFPGLVRSWRDLDGAAGRPPQRQALLRRLAAEPGVYVPSLYEVLRGPEGAFQGTLRREEEAPSFIQRGAWTDLLPAPTRPVVPHLETLPDRAVVELQRGCTLSCPSLLLGLTTSPLRQRPAAAVWAALQETLRSTGYEEVALSAPCLRDYPELEKLTVEAQRLCTGTMTALRLPPLALELLTRGLATALEAARPRGPLLLGPEVANGDLLEALLPGGALEGPLAILAGEAEGGPFHNLRLEAVLAHPTTSREEGWRAAAALVLAVRQAVGPQARLRVGLSFFIPRPFTPWQWAGQAPLAALREEAAAIQRALGRRVPRAGLAVADPEVAQVEAALARGDRRLGAVIRRAWAAGSYLDDSWGERPRPEIWQESFQAEGLDLEECATRSWALDDPLPWGHLMAPAEAQVLAELYRSQARAAPAPGR